MYRKKRGICRVQNYLHFQESTEDLTMHPLRVRMDYCAQTQEVQCRGRADGVYRWTRAEMKGEESTMNSRFQSEWLDRCQSQYGEGWDLYGNKFFFGGPIQLETSRRNESKARG